MTLANDTNRNALFVRERPHLLAVAFRILGSEADAQDIVQEAWIRFARADISDVRNVTAWLTTVVSRLCLDALRRARTVPQEPEDLSMRPGPRHDDPEQIALLASDLTEAFTIVLDQLTPPQRVALILHDVFGVPFTEVARVLDTTPDSAKKMASRARGRVRARQPAHASGADPVEARRVVGAFLTAVQRGDIAGLVTLLDPNVTRTADPQVVPPGASQVVHGAQAVASEARTFRVGASRAQVAAINGQPGIVIRSARGLQLAMIFRIAQGCVVHFDVVADSHRLARLRIDD